MGRIEPASPGQSDNLIIRRWASLSLTQLWRRAHPTQVHCVSLRTCNHKDICTMFPNTVRHGNKSFIQFFQEKNKIYDFAQLLFCWVLSRREIWSQTGFHSVLAPKVRLNKCNQSEVFEVLIAVNCWSFPISAIYKTIHHEASHEPQQTINLIVVSRHEI